MLHLTKPVCRLVSVTTVGNLEAMMNLLQTEGQPPDALSPEYWGLEEQDPSVVLRSLSKTMTVERRARRTKPKIPWSGRLSQPGVLDPALVSSEVLSSDYKEIWKERFGLKPSTHLSPNTLRPVIPQGALTPAAARVLARDANKRSGAKSRTTWSGQGFGVMAMLNDGEGTVSAPWKTLFHANPDVAAARDSPEPVRENRVSGLYVKPGAKPFLSNSAIGVDPNTAQPLSTTTPAAKMDLQSVPGGLELQEQMDELIVEEQWQELSNMLCNLQTMRKFVCHQSAEDGILKILQLLNRACSALEATAKESLAIGVAPPSAEHLERLRQHRRFILDYSSVFARRPQALLEKALFVSNTLPLVARNASEIVQGGDQLIREMKEALKAICSTPTSNIRAAAELAGLKARVREVSLMGSMQNAFCPAAIAARYRLMVARVGKRIIQTRQRLLESGISVDEATLAEIIRRDEGVYPSSFDESLAQQAIEEAKKALENLEKTLNTAQAEKHQHKRQQLDAAANAKAEENELRAIGEAERERDAARSESSHRNIQLMRASLCEEVWTRECVSRGGAPLGGALCVDESRVIVSCNDTCIEVFELETLLFDFIKTYTLDGHTKTVTCLATCERSVLFSGSLDSTIVVWNLETMTQAQVLTGHGAHVTSLAIADESTLSRDSVGKLLCSASFDTTIKIWRGEYDDDHLTRVLSAGSHDSHSPPVATWTCVRTLQGHGCYVHSLVADGTTLYSSGEDGLIKVWGVAHKHSIGQLEGCQDSIYALCIDAQLGVPVPTTEGETPKHEAAHRLLVSAGIELNMRAWNLESSPIVEDGIGTVEDSVVVTLSPMAEVEAVQTEVEALRKAVDRAVTHEGRGLLSANLAVMTEKADSEVTRSESFDYVRTLACENGLLYSGGGEDCVRIWSMEQAACVGHIDNVGKGVYALAASGRLLAVCSADKKLRVYGSGESQSQLEEELAERERRFTEEGGELWAMDLLTGAARMFLPKVRVSMMACGRGHGLLLDSHGFVWAWGESDKGQSGLGHHQTAKAPKRIERLAGVAGEQAVDSLRMKEIAAGDEHSLLLTHGGAVWVFGTNLSGQLGMQESQESRTLWEEMQSVSTALSGDPDSSQAVMAEADGQSSEGLREKLEEVEAAWATSQCVYIPTHNNVMKELRILHIAAGPEHSVFIDDVGIAHTCGLAENGQLGLPGAATAKRPDGARIVRIPHAVSEPFKEPRSREARIPIVGAAAGATHTLFLSAEGRAYSCGSNAYGQLGIGRNPQEGGGGDEATPTMVGALKEFALTQVAAGAQHSLFLTRTGEVYSCGNGEHGALGHGKLSAAFVPRRVAGIADPGGRQALTVRHVAATPFTSYFATTRGRSFYCGLRKPPPPDTPSSSTAASPKPTSKTRRRSATMWQGESAVLDPVTVPTRLAAADGIGNAAIGPACNLGTLSMSGVDQEIIMVVDSGCVPFHPFHRVGSASGRNSPSSGNHSSKGSPDGLLSDDAQRRRSLPEDDLPSPPRIASFPGGRG